MTSDAWNHHLLLDRAVATRPRQRVNLDAGWAVSRQASTWLGGPAGLVGLGRRPMLDSEVVALIAGRGARSRPSPHGRAQLHPRPALVAPGPQDDWRGTAFSLLVIAYLSMGVILFVSAWRWPSSGALAVVPMFLVGAWILLFQIMPPRPPRSRFL